MMTRRGATSRRLARRLLLFFRGASLRRRLDVSRHPLLLPPLRPGRGALHAGHVRDVHRGSALGVARREARDVANARLRKRARGIRRGHGDGDPRRRRRRRGGGGGGVVVEREDGGAGEGVANTASAPRETITTPTTASAASVASRADDENRDGFLFPDRAGRGEEEPSVANATSDGSDASFEKAPSPSPSPSSSSERSPPAESRRRL